MSYTLTSFPTGWDTTAGSTQTVNAAVPIWASQFSVTKNTPTEVTAQMTGSPLAAPTTVRWARQPIANVYTASGIDPGYRGPVVRGFSVLSQFNGVAEYTDSATPPGTVFYPIAAHLVMKLPAFENSDGGLTRQAVSWLLGTLFESGATSPQGRLNSLLRGALLPADLN